MSDDSPCTFGPIPATNSLGTTIQRPANDSCRDVHVRDSRSRGLDGPGALSQVAQEAARQLGGMAP
jgi:hypothetical protein